MRVLNVVEGTTPRIARGFLPQMPRRATAGFDRPAHQRGPIHRGGRVLHGGGDVRVVVVGGKLVIPVGQKEQQMMRFTRTSEKSFDKEAFGSFNFVPLLSDKI